MPEDQPPAPLTPDDLLGESLETGPVSPQQKRARDMATAIALMGLGLAAAGLLAILALVLNQLLVFAILAAIVLGGLYLGLHYIVWGRRLDRTLADGGESSRSPDEPLSQLPARPDGVDSDLT